MILYQLFRVNWVFKKPVHNSIFRSITISSGFIQFNKKFVSGKTCKVWNYEIIDFPSEIFVKIFRGFLDHFGKSFFGYFFLGKLFQALETRLWGSITQESESIRLDVHCILLFYYQWSMWPKFYRFYINLKIRVTIFCLNVNKLCSTFLCIRNIKINVF